MPRRFKTPKKSSKKKSSKRSRKTSIPRHPRNKGLGKDTYHFHETVSAGQLVIPTGATSPFVQSAVWIMRLPNFPAYTTLGASFEFVRLNRCTISYWPKANMQLNQFSATGGSQSISGTLIYGVDQVPLIGTMATASPASSWVTDGTGNTNVTLATPYTFQGATSSSSGLSYVRGLQNSKEVEMYKKVSQTFYPAFYDLIVDVFPTSSAAGSGGSCFNRVMRKWVNCTVLSNTGAGTLTSLNTGPIYYGPVYALDVNNIPATVTNFPIYDVRMTYSMSFKRLRGF